MSNKMAESTEEMPKRWPLRFQGKILEQIMADAKKNIRTPYGQVIWIVEQYYEGKQK